MKTRRHIFGGLTLAAAALVCLTGCKKDDEGEKVVLGADFEQTAGMQKTYVGNGDKTIYWNTEDQVKVNGKEYTVNEGAVEVKLNEDGYAAVYPKTGKLNGTGKNCTGGTVVIPATQTYTEKDGHQVLGGPMAARLDSKTGRLMFRNLYAVIKVTVQAKSDAPFTLNSITVESTNGKALAGSQAFTFSGSTNGIEANVVLSTTDLSNVSKSVTLTDIDSIIPAKGSASFYLYTVPFTGANLTVRLNGSLTDENSHERSGIDIARSQLRGTTVEVDNLIELSGGFVFSVGTTQKVVFSPGNLQYQASGNGTWRFAEHQYDYIGNAAGNTTAVDDRATQTDWIDLFGWGTSGYNDKFPYWACENDLYVSAENDIAGTQYDWGKNNKIGTDPAGTWRTLTTNEWSYLFKTRTKASDLCKTGVTVCGKTNCLIIAPDGFTGSIETSYNVTTWPEAEAAGLVCLPAAGYRMPYTPNPFSMPSMPGSNPSVAVDAGYYWSSSTHNDENAYYFKFTSLTYLQESFQPYYGCAVRLVKDIK